MQQASTTSRFDPEPDIEALKLSAKNKDPVAQYELGKAFRDGNGVEADALDAIYWYRQAAEAGHVEAQCDMAELYHNGTAVKGDLPQALRWYTEAAETGHARAQMLLGRLLEVGGEGIETDLIAAVRWYKKSAQQGLSMGQYNYGRCFFYKIGVTYNGEEAFKWFAAAIESDPDNLEALYELGRSYYFGCAGEKDLVKACQWYLKAAEKGHWEAQHDLAFCYEKGEGVEKNLEQALRWFKAAANVSQVAKGKVVELADQLGSSAGTLSEQEKGNLLYESAQNGNAEGSYRYALHLMNVATPIWKDVIAWLKWAGECGSEQGWKDLAKLYEEGNRVEQDLIEAASIYMKAYDRGVDVENDALRCLRSCFENQLYPDGAEEWLDKQARRNNPKVMIALATYWRSDRPGGRNFEESIKWYRKACALGDRDAQYLLGRFLVMKNLINKERLRFVRWWDNNLEKGMGDAASTADFDADTAFGQDKAYEQRSEALKWLHSAADEGSTEALRFLSAMYNRGLRVAVNPETAIQYLRRASELEDPKAHGLLGVAMLEGIGTKKSEPAAVGLLKRAAAGGDSFAQWNLAICLVDGIGADVDRTTAREMLERSAKGKFEQDRFWSEDSFANRFDKVIALFKMLQSHGQMEAQYWLGLCCEFGNGIERNRDRSVELYYLSSQQGYEPAIKAFSKVPENLQELAKKRLAK